MEIEFREQKSNFEKQVYKDQSSALAELQQQLRDKAEIIEEYDMARMNQEEQMIKERQQMES